MHPFTTRSLAALVLLGAPLGLASCGSSTSPSAQNTVAVQDNVFVPASITIDAGQSVTWQWGGSNQHNVTWVVTSGAGNSATQSSGSYTRTFDAPGSYDYYCSIHGAPGSGMHATIVVQ